MDNLEKIIIETFEQPFEIEQFDLFIRNLLNGVEPRDNNFKLIPQAYDDFIKSYKRIGKYVDPETNIIDILVVKLEKTTSVERARTAQRNFIARYLNTAMDLPRDAALVAFVSEDSPDWRFSLIWMDPKHKDGKYVLESSPAKRFSFLVGPNESSHTAKSQLKKCFLKSAKGEEVSLDDLVEAFSIEKVGQEFYDKYEDLYLELKKELDRLYETDPVIKTDFDDNKISRIDFAKKTLGQLVFLYFLQKKGWLGVKANESWGTGDPKFLRSLYESKYKKYDNFFNEILEPLFYKALREDRRDKKDEFKDLNCRIPFLNGGLFDPINDYDWQKTNITIDNEIFEKVFEVFDLYNFTVKEDEPLEKEVAVDPEMLGKVFEELLEVTERKSKGAFYTPREIVHYMCQESLVNYLATEFEGKVPKEDFETLVEVAESTYQNKSKRTGIDLPEPVKKHAQPIDDALKNIKICDPAIGSGAFPVGMMNEIVRLRTALNGEIHEEDRTAYSFKRQVIENSIYGVDIDPGAIEIARLRFWLSLVVDEEKLEDIEPLPNLDYKIMQGNSLISSYEDVDFDDLFAVKEKNIQRGLFTNDIQNQFDDLVFELKNTKDKYLIASDKDRKRELRDKIEKLIQEIILNKLEEKYTKDKVKGKAKAKKFSDVLIQMKEKKEFFPWKLWFSEVFEQKGGFDVVIGNPPYVDSEEMVKTLPHARNYCSEKYKSAKGNWDLYIPFFELGWNVIGKNKVLAFITPNKWLSIGYGKALRSFLLHDFIQICRCDKIKVFNAGNSPVITFFQKNKNSTELNINEFNEFKELIKLNSGSKNLITNSDNWGIFLSDNIELLLKISDGNIFVLDNYEAENPFATGEAYDIRELLENQKEIDLKEYFKLINTGTIDPYITLWGIKKTSYLKLKFDYPALKRAILKNYSEKRYNQSASSKIIITGMRYFECFLDSEGNYIAGKSTIIVRGNELKKLLGILNSKLISFFIKESYSALGIDGGINFSKDLVNTLPLPETDYSFLEKTVDKILEITKSDDYKENSEKQAKVKDYEKEIDLMVYKLYDLDYDKIKVIDPEFWLSEQQYIAYKCGESQECIALATTQEKTVAKTSESITTLKNFEFDKRPSTKAIIEKISEHNPDLLDNDRAFTEVFKSIAFKNGYSKQDIPKYWTIGRQIFDYKKEKDIKASPNADKRVALSHQVNFDEKVLSNFVFVKEDGKKYKPSIKEIIQRIVEYKPEYTENDWDILELFDAVALNNGYDEDSLPKYWNIIRAVYDLKKNLKSEEIVGG